VVDTLTAYKRQLDKSGETYFLDPKPIVTAKNVSSFEIYESSYNDKKYLGLTMLLDKEGTENWSFATRKAVITGMRLAFILDNRLLQVAKVNSQITGGVTALNRGDYSRQELENFKTLIESEK
jgi:preprotein translocase subunit SecD